MSKQSSSLPRSSHYTSLPPSPDVPRSTEYTSSEPVTERASSRLFLEGHGGMHKTVEKLKRLMEMELRSSIEKNSNLAEAVFPDESLPFTIDQDLINKLVPKQPSRSTRKKPKRRQQSYLNRPPNKWSEPLVCQWLNQIRDSLRNVYEDENIGAYINVDGNNIAPPRENMEEQLLWDPS